MARKPRVEYPGAFYHVICRGNHRQVIFRGDADRTFYLERLEKYRQRYGLTVYAYVLMSNHVHLLMEPGKLPLSKIMQGLQFTYTQYFNRKYRKVGHLFQGRYRAILSDRQAYLLELVRYLHLNPGHIRSPLDPWKYRWSGHGAYLGKQSSVRVEISAVLGELAKSVGPARRAYLIYGRGTGIGASAELLRCPRSEVMGEPRFVEEIHERIRTARLGQGKC